ncbi:hypothetical protein SAMN05444166_4843 [Singulisphaera sp. GP187]|nr:hypothetical protein SAMN05444166_4843 [Singulisphaera sp. GP187]
MIATVAHQNSNENRDQRLRLWLRNEIGFVLNGQSGGGSSIAFLSSRPAIHIPRLGQTLEIAIGTAANSSYDDLSVPGLPSSTI